MNSRIPRAPTMEPEAPDICSYLVAYQSEMRHLNRSDSKSIPQLYPMPIA